MDIEWSDNWPRFIEHVGAEFRGGATSADVAEKLAGMTVRWSGVVREVDLDELAPSVSVDMPKMEVDLGDGRKVPKSGLHLPVARDAMRSWQQVKPGDNITFEATLGAGRSPFPAVAVETIEGGRTLLSIRVTNARVVEP